MKISVKEFKRLINETKRELGEKKIPKVVKVGPTQLKKMVENYAKKKIKKSK